MNKSVLLLSSLFFTSGISNVPYKEMNINTENITESERKQYQWDINKLYYNEGISEDFYKDDFQYTKYLELDFEKMSCGMDNKMLIPIEKNLYQKLIDQNSEYTFNLNFDFIFEDDQYFHLTDNFNLHFGKEFKNITKYDFYNDNRFGKSWLNLFDVADYKGDPERYKLEHFKTKGPKYRIVSDYANVIEKDGKYYLAFKIRAQNDRFDLLVDYDHWYVEHYIQRLKFNNIKLDITTKVYNLEKVGVISINTYIDPNWIERKTPIEWLYDQNRKEIDSILSEIKETLKINIDIKEFKNSLSLENYNSHKDINQLKFFIKPEENPKVKNNITINFIITNKVDLSMMKINKLVLPSNTLTNEIKEIYILKELKKYGISLDDVNVKNDSNILKISSKNDKTINYLEIPFSINNELPQTWKELEEVNNNSNNDESKDSEKENDDNIKNPDKDEESENNNENDEDEESENNNENDKGEESENNNENDINNNTDDEKEQDNNENDKDQKEKDQNKSNTKKAFNKLWLLLIPVCIGFVYLLIKIIKHWKNKKTINGKIN